MHGIEVEFLLLKVSRSTRLPGAASTHGNQVVYKKIYNISARPVFTIFWSAIWSNEQFINANNATLRFWTRAETGHLGWQGSPLARPGARSQPEHAVKTSEFLFACEDDDTPFAPRRLLYGTRRSSSSCVCVGQVELRGAPCILYRHGVCDPP